MLTDLMKSVDQFLERYTKDDPSRKGMKEDLMELVQKAVDHGEGKDQGKIVGVATKLIKGFFGSKKDD
jgi:hypothetical protein